MPSFPIAMDVLDGESFSANRGNSWISSSKHLINSQQGTKCKVNFREHPFQIISRQILADEDNSLRTRLCSLLASDRETDFLRLLEIRRPEFLDAGCADGCTMLQNATQYGHVRAALALLEADANPNGTSCKELTAPLIIAARQNHQDVLAVLLEIGRRKINVNATDVKGNSALHYSAEFSNVSSVALLLKSGADPGVRNLEGRPALDMEQTRHLFDCCLKKNESVHENELLLDFGLFIPTSRFVAECGEYYNDSPIRYSTISQKIENETRKVGRNQEDSMLGNEMCVLRKLSVCKTTKDALDHPFVEAYVELKWQPVKYILYADFLFHILYIVLMLFTSVKTAKCMAHSVRKDISGYREDLNYLTCIKVDNVVLGYISMALGIISVIREVCRVYFFKNMYSFYEYCFLVSLLVNFVSYVIVFTLTHHFILSVVTSVPVVAFLFNRSPFHQWITQAVDIVSKKFTLFLLSQLAVIAMYGVILHAWYLHNTFHGTYVESEGLGYFKTMGETYINMLLIMTGSLEIKTSNMLVKSAVVYVMLTIFLIFSLMTALAVRNMKNIEKEISIKRLQRRIFLLSECEHLLINFYKILIRIPCVPRCILNFLHRGSIFNRSHRIFSVKRNCTFSGRHFIRNCDSMFPDALVNRLLHALNNRKEIQIDSLTEVDEIISHRELENSVRCLGRKMENHFNEMYVAINETVLVPLHGQIRELEEKLDKILKEIRELNKM